MSSYQGNGAWAPPPYDYQYPTHPLYGVPGGQFAQHAPGHGWDGTGGYGYDPDSMMQQAMAGMGMADGVYHGGNPGFPATGANGNVNVNGNGNVNGNPVASAGAGQGTTAQDAWARAHGPVPGMVPGWAEPPPLSSGAGPATKGESIVSMFMAYTLGLLQAVSEAFDECTLVRAKLDELRYISGNKSLSAQFCRAYHEKMRPFYDACRNHNVEPFLDPARCPAVLSTIDFSAKLAELTDKEVYTKEDMDQNLSRLWEFIEEMNKYASLNAYLPQGIAEKIEKMTASVADSVYRGAPVEDFDLEKIGRELMEQADDGDIGQLISNMGPIFESTGGASKFRELFKGRGATGAKNKAGVDQLEKLMGCMSRGGTPGVRGAPSDAEAPVAPSTHEVPKVSSKGWKPRQVV